MRDSIKVWSIAEKSIEIGQSFEDDSARGQVMSVPVEKVEGLIAALRAEMDKVLGARLLKLTSDELRHLRDAAGVHSIEGLKKTMRHHAKTRKTSEIEPCWDCKAIARKLGLLEVDE